MFIDRSLKSSALGKLSGKHFHETEPFFSTLQSYHGLWNPKQWGKKATCLWFQGKRFSLFICIVLNSLRVTLISSHLAGLWYTDADTMQRHSSCKVTSLSRSQDPRTLITVLTFPAFHRAARTETRMLLKRADILNSLLHTVYLFGINIYSKTIQFSSQIALLQGWEKSGASPCPSSPSKTVTSKSHLKTAATGRVGLSLCFV